MSTATSTDSEILTSYSDTIYAHAWSSVLNECNERLDPTDLAEAIKIKTLNDFRAKVETYLSASSTLNESGKSMIRVLCQTLGPYETFAEDFVNMMQRSVDVSMMWGLLYLVVEVGLTPLFASSEPNPHSLP